MLRGIDGKILHLKELGFIEKQLAGELLSPEDFYNSLVMFLNENWDLANKMIFKTEDLRKVDEFLETYFSIGIDAGKVWLLRAYTIGRMLSLSDISATVFNIADVSRMPRYLIEAAQEYGLTLQEVKALEFAIEESAALMSNTTQSTIQTVRNIVVESVKKRGNAESLGGDIRSLVNEAGELNRNWRRVAITETNSVFNNGYLSALSQGDWVVGVSMPDCCEHCDDEINGKVFKVRNEAPIDYMSLSPESDEYKEIAKIWETEIWAGKNNYGRTFSKQKRIDSEIGNKPANLRAKEHHEHGMPATPAHPNCRCRWSYINPEAMYVDEDKQLRLRLENEAEWADWYAKNIGDITNA